MLEKALRLALHRCAHREELFNVMEYAVLPAGKLFRPKLVEALSLDLNSRMTGDHLHLACAIELHHAYTLVHDDLPAMDDDLVRRGKPSVHAAFGEWKAILAGDALLISSFSELMNIQHENIRNIHHLMSWATGAKGLIKGQFMDLEANGNLHFGTIVQIHELKTARLIQVATLGTCYLSKNHLSLREKIDFLKLGRDIGVCFQLLDDLSELSCAEVSAHEKTINPFIISARPALFELKASYERLESSLARLKLRKLNSMLSAYFRANQKNLLSNFDSILNHSSANSDGLLLKNWLTSFV